MDKNIAIDGHLGHKLFRLDESNSLTATNNSGSTIRVVAINPLGTYAISAGTELTFNALMELDENGEPVEGSEMSHKYVGIPGDTGRIIIFKLIDLQHQGLEIVSEFTED